MATAYQIQVGPEDTGLWKANHQTDEAARKVSELLQRDLREHHCFFNTDGFHNHIAHHLLTLYGTGASSAPLQKGYDGNTSYQRSTTPKLPQEMRSWDDAKQYLGKEQYYSDFLVFFQKEIDKMGWEAVMAEYVFKGDERADDLLGRLFAGTWSIPPYPFWYLRGAGHVSLRPAETKHETKQQPQASFTP